MLQTVLILQEHPVAPAESVAELYDDDAEPNLSHRRFHDPATVFRASGHRIIVNQVQEDIQFNVRNVDAIVFYLPFFSFSSLPQLPSLPCLWWCENERILHNCNLTAEIDAILYPGITVNELHWSLLLATKNFLRRTQWEQEREQLLSKLEDRKWIERAKSILAEIKHISEAEAYEFLRKQAMNERRRIADVAVSIVKVYSLIREQNQRGRSK